MLVYAVRRVGFPRATLLDEVVVVVLVRCSDGMFGSAEERGRLKRVK